MHCFNNNYVIPASVAFYSMLENANPEYKYNLYILHSDITEENQDKLQQTITNFNNSSLTFINMQEKFKDLFENTVVKGHYSKEMFYKFLAPSTFPQYEKIIISDVDVVYLGDISPSYFFINAEDDIYFAGHKGPILKGSWIDSCSFDQYKKFFSDQEIEKLQTGAGYYVFNLKKMRQNKIEQKFIDYAIKNSKRLLQPEQDVINLCCYPKIKFLPLRNLVCSYCYDLYQEEKDFENDLNYSKEELKEGLENPIQLHYATSTKPWNRLSCTKAEEWFKVLVKTPFLFEFLEKLDKQINMKTLISFDLKLSKKKKYCIKLVKTKLK
jgi:lipopolysaccharide biosynthesis glycosyltransferase